jgi:hypothetical protein
VASDEDIDFVAWRSAFRRALDLGEDAPVPCAGCTACCRSSQFVHIEPDEAATLARIDPALLFPAPARPAGHMVLGYDDRGWCPMLTADGCGIYENRPRTCRTYDCRVFAAAGLEPDRPLIAEQMARWSFADGPERSAAVDRARQLAARGAGAGRAALSAVLDL